MQKDVTCKNRRDREENLSRLFFSYPVGEMKNAQKKRNKKMKNMLKNFLTFPGTKCYTIKRTFARGLFLTHKRNAFQKFTTENSPTRGAKEQRKEDSS